MRQRFRSYCVLACVSVLGMAAPAWAQDRLLRDNWSYGKAGPFEVYTNAGERAAQDLLGDLEQFRHAVSSVTGIPELKMAWPIRVVAFKPSREQEAYILPEGLFPGRTALHAVLPPKGGIPAEWRRACAALLLEAGAGRAPEPLRQGLVTLFSTIEIDGTRITLGEPPPPAERDLNWARAHLLAVHPDYYGKLRVLMRNLQSVPSDGVAYRNSVGKNPAEIEKLAQAYLNAGQFPTAPVSGLAVNARRDYRVERSEPETVQTMLADLLLADPGKAAAAETAFEAITKQGDDPAGPEGLALLALRHGDKETAKLHLEKAIAMQTRSARAYLEAGKLESDWDKAFALMRRAGELNPEWAAPHEEIAARAGDPRIQSQAFANAAKLAPHRVELWKGLAQAFEASSQHEDAAKAWSEAEKAASTETERQALRETRLAAGNKRIEEQQAAIAQRKQAERDELEALRQRELARIRALEDEVNKDDQVRDPKTIETWWGGKKPSGRVTGMLTRIECSGRQYVLSVETEGKGTLRLLVADPAQTLAVNGEIVFQCRSKIEPRRVSVEYFPKQDSKTRTAGEIAIIELR